MPSIPDPSRILTVIPALNEAEALPGVLDRLRKQGLSRIRVVDNGSTDETAAVAAGCGAEVVTEPRKGYGQACWTGLQNLPGGIDWIFFCDADGSDDLDQLPAFLAAAKDHDFVLGDRRATAESAATLTLPQRWGNALATGLIRLGWGTRYHDLGPMRLVRRRALEQIAMEDRGFGWTVEMQIRAAESGLRIREIPVLGRERQGGHSKISGTVRGVMMAGSVILGTWGKFFLRKAPVQTFLKWGSMALLFAGAAIMMPSGNFARHGVLPSFWAGAWVMSAGYGLSWGLRSVSRAWLLFAAIGCRLILLPMFPSDDVWRYLWEGWVQNHGFNPYVLAPSSAELAHLRTPWWDLIQHRDITAIYPPLAQGLLRVAASVPGWALLKGMVVAADLAVVLLLARKLGTVKAAYYAWCPLMLLVFAGGAHFDSWMLLAMVAGWLLWDAGKWRPAALSMGVACGIKYVAAPLLAWMLWRLALENRRKAAVAALLALLPTALAIALLPPPLDPTHWLPRDFAQYARSADFLPRLVAECWEGSLRLNALYLFPAAAWAVWVVWTSRTLARAGQNWFLGLLLVSPLVHTWYLAWALPFAAASGHLGWRMAGMFGLVYYALQQTAFEERTWLLTWPQWLLFWGPLVLGTLWTITRSRTAGVEPTTEGKT